MQNEAPATPEFQASKQSRWFWLRVAVSVFFSLLTVALCVLWVRSYWRWDSIRAGYPPFLYAADSANGHWGLGRFDPNDSEVKVTSSWKYSCDESERAVMVFRGDSATTLGSWEFRFGAGGFRVVTPYWFPAILFLATAITLWKLRAVHFSLRSLLIAMTLLALVLGLAVWMVR